MPSFFMPRNTAVGLMLWLAGASAAFADSYDGDANMHRAFGLNNCEMGESLGQCWNRTGQRLSESAADKARDRANGLEKSAMQRAELADQIGADRNALGSRLNQLAGLEPSEAVRQKNNLLDQAYNPQAPADSSQSSRSMEEAMRKLGLASQRDLWQKGPEAQRALNEEARNEATEAGQLFRAASEGARAAGKLGQMAEISRQRQEGIKSVPAAGAAVSSKAGAGSPDGTGYESAGPGAAGSAGGARTASLTKGESGKALQWQGEAGARAGAAAAAGRGPSLRDQLRAALAAAKTRGDQKESARLEKELAAAEKQESKAGAEGAPSRTLASVAETLPRAGFSMGVDDAQAVRSTVEAFERTLSEASAPSEDPRTLFQRVTTSIRGSLAAGRIR